MRTKRTIGDKTDSLFGTGFPGDVHCLENKNRNYFFKKLIITMATYLNGINGPVKGNIGTVEGASWKGIPVLKARKRSRRRNSVSQVEQQARFAFVNHFVKTLVDLFGESFHEPAKPLTGLNLAFRYTYQHALLGVYPHLELDYRKVLVSRGTLMPAFDATIQVSGSGMVQFNWTNNAGIAQANAGDHALLVLHCPQLNRSMYSVGNANRKDGIAYLDASIFKGHRVHAWLAFVNEERTEWSCSLYAGSLQMP